MENEIDFLIKLTRIDKRVAAEQGKHIRRETRKIVYAFREDGDIPENLDDLESESSSDQSDDSDSFITYSNSLLEKDITAEISKISIGTEPNGDSTSTTESSGVPTGPCVQNPFKPKLYCTIKEKNKDTRWDYSTASFKQQLGSNVGQRNKRRSTLTKVSPSAKVQGSRQVKVSRKTTFCDDNTCMAVSNCKYSGEKNKDRLESMKAIPNRGSLNPKLDVEIVRHLRSCGKWLKRRKGCCLKDQGHGRRRVNTEKWTKWMSHMQSRMDAHLLDYGSEDEDENRFRKETPIEKWRRKAKVVRRLCGVCLTLRKYAVEAGLMNNFVVSVSSRRLCISGENGDVTEELEWDLENYKAKQEIPIPRTTIEILEQLPQHRTTHDIQVIAMLMRSLPSFRKYTNEMQKMMCRIVRYMRCTSRRVVLRKGHVGYSVYFIVRGSVSVVMGKDDQSVFVKPEVVILRKGACFGEIALLQNTRRNATIVCAEDCEFLVIDKEDFIQNGLNQRLDQEFAYRYNTYRNWLPIQSWNDESIKKLAYCSRTEDFSHNKVIVQSSKVNEFLWFVVQGSCDVLRLVDLNNRPELHTLRTLPSGVQRFLGAPPSPRQPTETETKKKRAQSAPLRPKSVLQRRVKSARMSQPQETQAADSDSSTQSTYSSLCTLNGKGSTVSSGSTNSSSDVTLKPPTSEPYRKSEHKDVSSPIYVQVDQLRDGQCFGLESLFTDIDTSKHQYSLVSKGCILIHVPRRKFLELTDDKSLQRIRLILKDYPDDHDLIDGFLQKRIWDNFKQNVVEEIIIDKIHTAGAGDKGLRCDKVEEYMKRKDTNDVTYGTMLNEDANSKARHKLKHALESRSVRPHSAAPSSSSRNTNNSHNARLTRLLAAEQFTPRFPKVFSHPNTAVKPPTINQRLSSILKSPRHKDTNGSHISVADAHLDGSVALDAKLRHLKSQSTILCQRKGAETRGGQLKSRSIVVTSKEKREVATTHHPPHLKATSRRPQTQDCGFMCKMTPRTLQRGSDLHLNTGNALKSSSTVLSGQ